MLMIFLLFLIINFISLMMLMINFFLSKFKFSFREKSSSFECGFELIELSRLPFSIHFYLIGVLFLVFDVEIVLLLPLINSFVLLNMFTWIFSSLLILLILYIGLEFEKKEGVLKWFI